MSTTKVVLTGLLLTLVAAGAQVDGDRPKLQGVWQGYVVDGKGENPNQGPLHLQVTISADKISAINLGDGGKSMGEGTYRLDPAKQAIDASGVVLPGKRSRDYAGIFALEGDTLKWCVDNQQKGRPTEFRTVKGQYLLILKRKN